jgi:hypothetical protein
MGAATSERIGVSRNTWPIIIGGCHRSGTSLIRRILNAHSRIYCGPEVKFFRDFYNDYANDPIRHARFMISARDVLPEPELLELLGQAFVKLHERAAARAGKPRWADKNPENVVYLDQWQQLLGDGWFFIHVVRNPLDTLASIAEIRFPFALPTELVARIAFYRRYTQAGLDFGAAHPDRYFRLVYERLVHAPQDTLEHLMLWLGETFESGQLEFNKFPQQSGLEDPKIAGTSKIHAESIGRWLTILSNEEARIIWRETRELWALIDRDGCHDPLAYDVNGLYSK